MGIVAQVIFSSILIVVGIAFITRGLASSDSSCGTTALKFLLVALLVYSILGLGFAAVACRSRDEASRQLVTDPVLLGPKASLSSRPRVIYSYWDNAADIPQSVQRCIASWKRHNPEYSIVVVSATELAQYLEPRVLETVQTKSPQMTSDFLRLAILKDRGGIWLDATTYLNAPLDSWLDIPELAGREFIGFQIDLFTTRPETPVVESWFLAAVPHSRFIGDWYRAFTRMIDFATVRDYIADLTGRGTDLQKLPDPEYLAIHAACQDVLQHAAPGTYSLGLLHAENGPFFHKSMMGFNPIWFPVFFAVHQAQEAPIVKYTKAERRMLESLHLYYILLLE